MVSTVIENIRQTRKNMLQLLEAFTYEEITSIPKSMNNHLLWNYGHSIVTQHILTYGLSGLRHSIDEEVLQRYRKGSLPKEHNYPFTDLAMFSKLSRVGLDLLKVDYEKKAFIHFKPYTTSYGVVLSSIEEAIVFNAQHEALHLGFMMAQRRILSH